MSLVRATCPGCRKLLRIPAEWIRQPIRCKHCGIVLHAKLQTGAAPPASPKSIQATPPAAQPTPVTMAQPPVALPVYSPTADTLASPFGNLTDDQPSGSVRRRKRSNMRTALLVSLLLLLVTAGIAATVIFLKFGSDTGKQVPGISNPNSTDDKPPTKAMPLPSSRTGPEKEKIIPKRGEKEVSYPRRALLISIHNYLYANPVSAGSLVKGARTIAGLLDKLSNGLRIPRNQIVHLSDAAKPVARPPLKSTIEKTLTAFLTSSRAQDRILVFFVGHAVELGDEVYLAPLEGELDNAATLIPLKWVYQELAKCPARQKVLVLDVCRLDPVEGSERPGGDAMGPKLAAAIQSPPPGVQVWSACSPQQHSYETENDAMGVFLDELQTHLERLSGTKSHPSDKTQKPDDLLPLEQLKEMVDQGIEKEIGPLKLTQKTLLTGKPADDGASFDPAEPMPASPKVVEAPPPASVVDQNTLTMLFNEFATPPAKSSRHNLSINYSFLPPFDKKTLEPYLADPGDDTELRKIVRKTQVLLYAISTAGVPRAITKEVDEERRTLRGNLSILRDGYRAPTNNDQFKNRILNDEKDVARIMTRLNMAREDMKNVADGRKAEPKRWQANYDFMLARLEAQIAYLYEYESMLGQMRKELPPRNPELHGGWKLAATPSLTGDSTGKKIAASSRKAFDKLIKENPGTPWEVLAKREKLTALGLEWKPAK